MLKETTSNFWDSKDYSNVENQIKKEMGFRTYKIEDMLKKEKFPKNNFLQMSGEELNLEYVQKNGLNAPIYVQEKSGLGLKVPTDSIKVNDIRSLMGSNQLVDVLDSYTNSRFKMNLWQWQLHYLSEDENKVPYSMCIELSKSKMDLHIEPPVIVKQLDWVDCVWPTFVKAKQRYPAKCIEDMLYPNVQKYCLMFTKGSFVDFNVCIGGASFWYHCVRGKQMFWLIPPTENNLKTYSKIMPSQNQFENFLGEKVDGCEKILVEPGNTIIIPSGWIYASYSLENCIGFGGNFLHSYAIKMQLKISEIENKANLQDEFKYPMFTESLWYLLACYVEGLLGRKCIRKTDEVNFESNAFTISSTDHGSALHVSKNMENKKGNHIHISTEELLGLKAVIQYIHSLPYAKKCVPLAIISAVDIIKDIRKIIELHLKDDQKLAIISQPIFLMNNNMKVINSKLENIAKYKSLEKKTMKSKVEPVCTEKKFSRCNQCEACLRKDCGECDTCLRIRSGQESFRSTCLKRICLQRTIIARVSCTVCGKGWGQDDQSIMKKECDTMLMQCSKCYNGLHSNCANLITNNKMSPKEYKCNKCSDGILVKLAKHMHISKRSDSSDPESVSENEADTSGSELEIRKLKNLPRILNGNEVINSSNKATPLNLKPSVIHRAVPFPDCLSNNLSIPTPRNPQHETKEIKILQGSVPPDIPNMLPVETSVRNIPPRPLHVQLREVLDAYQCSQQLREPSFVVRPTSIDQVDEMNFQNNNDTAANFVLKKSIMLPILQKLQLKDLMRCSIVCKTWNRFCGDSSLWTNIDLSHKSIRPDMLTAIVRRQPLSLNLGWSNVTRKQLQWLLSRLKHLKRLNLQGCSLNSVLGLIGPNCPILNSLDVSFVGGFDDSVFKDLFSPFTATLPGLTDNRNRLRNVSDLKLSGTNISDVSLNFIAQHLNHLKSLDIELCNRVTDKGLCEILSLDSCVYKMIESLCLRHCLNVMGSFLKYLKKCENLKSLDIRKIAGIYQEVKAHDIPPKLNVLLDEIPGDSHLSESAKFASKTLQAGYNTVKLPDGARVAINNAGKKFGNISYGNSKANAKDAISPNKTDAGICDNSLAGELICSPNGKNLFPDKSQKSDINQHDSLSSPRKSKPSLDKGRDKPERNGKKPKLNKINMSLEKTGYSKRKSTSPKSPAYKHGSKNKSKPKSGISSTLLKSWKKMSISSIESNRLLSDDDTKKAAELSVYNTSHLESPPKLDAFSLKSRKRRGSDELRSSENEGNSDGHSKRPKCNTAITGRKSDMPVVNTSNRNNSENERKKRKSDHKVSVPPKSNSESNDRSSLPATNEKDTKTSTGKSTSKIKKSKFNDSTLSESVSPGRRRSQSFLIDH